MTSNLFTHRIEGAARWRHGLMLVWLSALTFGGALVAVSEDFAPWVTTIAFVGTPFVLVIGASVFPRSRRGGAERTSSGLPRARFLVMTGVLVIATFIAIAAAIWSGSPMPLIVCGSAQLGFAAGYMATSTAED